MIKTESFIIGQRRFIRTYSDCGRYVVRDGIAYEGACDPEEFHRQYTEGDLIDFGEMSEIDHSAKFLLWQNLITLPAQKQIDYFNENENEPNYFG